MRPLSQIVGESATPFCHSLNVVHDFSPWHFVGVEKPSDKNGGPNYLRAWREHRGMTQEALAKAVDTSTNMIQYLESGERSLSLKWLRRLAPALKTTPGQLADGAPSETDIEIHNFLAHANREQRRQLSKIAEALIDRTGTND